LQNGLIAARIVPGDRHVSLLTEEEVVNNKGKGVLYPKIETKKYCSRGRAKPSGEQRGIV
jgi:hypothetical protein